MLSWEDEYEEGTDPGLDEETGMYVFVHSAQEGVPFFVQVNAFEDMWFNARTPYYVDLDDVGVNEYGSVGSGSIAVDNGHTEGDTIYVEYHSFAGTIQSESCGGYECQVVMSWDGPD